MEKSGTGSFGKGGVKVEDENAWADRCTYLTKRSEIHKSTKQCLLLRNLGFVTRTLSQEMSTSKPCCFHELRVHANVAFSFSSEIEGQSVLASLSRPPFTGRLDIVSLLLAV